MITLNKIQAFSFKKNEKPQETTSYGFNFYNNYLIILDTDPAPTVLPPSRIENLVPCSIAIG